MLNLFFPDISDVLLYSLYVLVTFDSISVMELESRGSAKKCDIFKLFPALFSRRLQPRDKKELQTWQIMADAPDIPSMQLSLTCFDGFFHQNHMFQNVCS